MLWKDYSSFWCSAGLFHKGLSFLVHLQATSMVFCILPFFLLIPSGSLPPTVSGLSRANRCSSKGKDAHPLVVLGLWCCSLQACWRGTGNSLPVCPALFSDCGFMTAGLICYSLKFSVRSSSRCQIRTWTSVLFLIWCAESSSVHLLQGWDTVFSNVLDWAIYH